MEENDVYNSQTQQQQLSYRQEQASRIASSFVSRDYNPHPWFRNQHVQTILGVFLRDECGYVTNLLETISTIVTKGLPRVVTDDNSESSSEYWDQRIRYETPDDDFFDVDYKYASSPEKAPLVIVVHGLESNSNSSLCLHMARAYVDQGMNVACINFRGCSGELNRTMKPYHAGFTDDLKQYLTILSEDDNNKINNGLYLSGFSLGANVVMKTLGELSLDAVEKYNIQGAAVSGAPFSLNYHWRCLIDDDFNRNVYANNLLKSMKKKVQYYTDTYCNGDTETTALNYWKAMNATTIPEMEEAMICPLFGFTDLFDYYDRSASLNEIEDIAVPLYVLNAQDDPFFRFSECPSTPPIIRFEQTPYGGHLGHLFHQIEQGDGSSRISSFAPIEMARFLNHVQENRSL
eukprot:CAMPEP_0178932048 /NCGR_PEP_ID=MMETSP0786-20121207/22341_1 /TAXON_ID=186022 /ORGANISM="Thalassionema frauenfeldii, Strain CCMP 1798" /LENGTH=403 /DNA_ID=CAMNT_0020609177 /DNA_START=263 /DNA_END=1474 /DNA_ORIENTATION=-